jgi:hypothetical protein
VQADIIIMTIQPLISFGWGDDAIVVDEYSKDASSERTTVCFENAMFCEELDDSVPYLVESSDSSFSEIEEVYSSDEAENDDGVIGEIAPAAEAQCSLLRCPT